MIQGIITALLIYLVATIMKKLQEKAELKADAQKYYESIKESDRNDWTLFSTTKKRIGILKGQMKNYNSNYSAWKYFQRESIRGGHPFLFMSEKYNSINAIDYAASIVIEETFDKVISYNHEIDIEDLQKAYDMVKNKPFLKDEKKIAEYLLNQISNLN